LTENEEQKDLHPILEFIISTRFAGLCGIIGPLIALIGIVAAILVSPWFNWLTNALSDLGHPWMLGGSNGTPGLNPAAPIFNTSLSLAGLITLMMTIWLIRHQVFERSVIGIIAAILLTIAQFFLIGIGIFHEGFGYTHFVVSVGFFVTLLVAGMIYGVRLMQEKHLRLIGVMAFILALVSALIWVAYYLNVLPFTGVAIPEIISAITAIIWVYPLCILLLLQKQM
jgi:hypothetical membrane protein